ncbi:MAG TPA: M23 family metallopeptidase [Polyangia bacterium]|nr:M23 family metallopeptidase [Polyangia bacterium]
MTDATDTSTTSARRCPHCGGPVDVRTPHVIIDGSTVRSYCSAECASLATAPIRIPPEPPQGNRWLSHVVRLAVSVPVLVLTSGYEPPRPPAPAPAAIAVEKPAPAPEPPSFGPAWPPTEQDWMAEIAGDAWIHPLDGPSRRMPLSDSRVFGAERAGERPGECNNGHCGVDLSGPWGEPVHAAHDGVVDRVQRGPNEEHGGVYVRLAHRDGTIFSQYFHLAAVPRRLEPGVRVRVGEVIGLLGDTGVKHSAPHLHFTISVKPSAEYAEKYIDPEPLIALWPLRIPVGESAGMLTAQAAPGVPHGAAAKHHHPSHRTAAALEPPPEAAATE